MRTTMLVLLLAAGALGCADSRSKTTALQGTVDAQAREIAALQADLEALRTQVAAARTGMSTGLLEALSGRLDRLVTARVEAALKTRLQSAVDQSFADRVGTREDIDSIFQAAVDKAVDKAVAKVKVDLQSPRGPADAAAWRAQFPEPRVPSEAERLEALAADIKLTDQQKELVRTAYAATQQNIRDTLETLRKDNKMESKEIHAAIEAARARQDETLKTILSPDQMEAYKKRPRSSVTWWSSSSGAGGFTTSGGGAVHVMTGVGEGVTVTPPAMQIQIGGPGDPKGTVRTVIE